MRTFFLYFLMCLGLAACSLNIDMNHKLRVEETLDAFHMAASKADGEAYFDLFTQDGIFIGTADDERWTVREFREYAKPHFAKGNGWTYIMRTRNIRVSDNGQTAWFDEILWSDTYGLCRGTGVLSHVSGQWKIAQYHLTFPIPNELSKEITQRTLQYRSGLKNED